MSLLRHASKVSSINLLSRVSGFIRDSVFAATFGAGAELDVFLLAFKVPNFLRRIFAEGAFGQAFIPVLAEYNQQDPEIRAGFLSTVFSLLLFWVSVLTIAVWVYPEGLVRIFAMGYAPGSSAYLQASFLMRFVFPYLGLIAVSTFFSAALQSKDHFQLPALSPIILNIVLITAALGVAHTAILPLYAFAAAVPLAGILQVAMLWFGYRKCFPAPKLVRSVAHSGAKKVMRLMAIGSYGVGVCQIGLIVDNSILTFLAKGSVSWVYFADRLCLLPLGVFGIAIATVLGPALARSFLDQKHAQYVQRVEWGVVCAGMLGIPCAIGLICFAKPIVIGLFCYKAFTIYHVEQTVFSLQIMALGVPAFMWVKVLGAAFFARQDTYTPTKAATISVMVNIAVALLSVYYLRHAAIALAVVFSSYWQAWYLYRQLSKQGVFQLHHTARLELAKITLASMSMVLVALAQPDVTWLLTNTVWLRLLYIASIVCTAAVLYALGLWGMRIQMHKVVWQA